MTSSDGKSQPRMMQRAALYLRVSTARQAEHDVSIPDQRRAYRRQPCGLIHLLPVSIPE